MEVEQEQVELPAASLLQRLLAVARPHHRVPAGIQQVAHELEVERIVFGHQHVGHQFIQVLLSLPSPTVTLKVAAGSDGSQLGIDAKTPALATMPGSSLPTWAPSQFEASNNAASKTPV